MTALLPVFNIDCAPDTMPRHLGLGLAFPIRLTSWEGSSVALGQVFSNRHFLCRDSHGHRTTVGEI